MGIAFRKNFDLKALADEARKRRKTTLERELEEAAREIVTRTQQGIDVNGSRFKRYSKEYELAKRKKLGGPTQPDLTASGRMLASIRTEVKERGNGLTGRIYVLASQAVKALANQKLRRFFGLSKKQIQQLTDALRNEK